MLILIFGSKSGFGDNFGKSDQFMSRLDQKPLRHSVTMETAKVPGDQNYLKMCALGQYKKSQSFSFLLLTVSVLCKKAT